MSEPMTGEEEAKFRESVRILEPVSEGLQWANSAVMRLLATLDAERLSSQPAPDAGDAIDPLCSSCAHPLHADFCPQWVPVQVVSCACAARLAALPQPGEPTERIVNSVRVRPRPDLTRDSDPARDFDGPDPFAALPSPETTPAGLDVERLRAALVYGIERQLGPGSAIEFDSAIGSAVAEYDRLTLTVSSPETTPAGVLDEAALNVERMTMALFAAWPRTFGARLSWSQPSREMAAHIAAEYDAIGRPRIGVSVAALGRSGSGGGRG